MYILKEIGNRPNIPYNEYTCDSVADIINIKNANFGDECYIIEAQSLYVKGSENKWKLINGISGAAEEIEIPSNEILLIPGLYQTGAIALCEQQGVEAIEGMMIKSWDELLAEGTVHVEDGIVYSNFDEGEWENTSSDAISGDLIFPNDDSITVIGYCAFSFCTNLTSVVIPDSVTSIGDGAFYHCTSLTSVVIPNSVTDIADGVFYGCTNLTSVVIPNSVTRIGYYAFGNCTNLTSITYAGTTSEWKDLYFGQYWDDNTGSYIIYCTDGYIEKDGTVTLH